MRSKRPRSKSRSAKYGKIKKRRKIGTITKSDIVIAKLKKKGLKKS